MDVELHKLVEYKDKLVIVNNESIVRSGLQVALDREDLSLDDKSFIKSLLSRKGKRRKHFKLFADMAATLYLVELEKKDPALLAIDIDGDGSSVALSFTAAEDDDTSRRFFDFLRFIIETAVENDFAFIKWLLENIPKLIQAITVIFI